VWTIFVTAGAFDGATQRWLTFASAVAIAGLCVAAESANVHASESPVVRPVATREAA
jgi:hypothetical protein